MRELLLKPLGTILIPATLDSFIVSDRIAAIEQNSCKIESINFMERFSKKKVGPIKGAELQYDQLIWSVEDGLVIQVLGGESKLKTVLTEMLWLLDKQKEGQGGILLNSRCGNVFYDFDSDGELNSICISQDDGHWTLSAMYTSLGLIWKRDQRIFHI